MPLLPSILPSVYTAFIVSFAVTVLLVLTKRWHGRFSMDGVQGVQKQHKVPTPRIGGVAIVLGVLAGWLVAMPERQAILGPLLVAGLPAFAFGLAEDLTKKVSVMARLLATMASGVLGWWLTGMSLTSLDIAGVDVLMGITLVSVAFTAFAVGGVANAINIIDGFNGLASGFVVLALLGLAAMAMSSQDPNLAIACLGTAGAMLGFWLVNWPWGKIFLGDGGSYFGGFALAWACIMVVERNPEISPFRTAHLPGVCKPFLMLQGDQDEYGTAQDARRYPLSPTTVVEPVASGHDYDCLAPQEYRRCMALLLGFLGAHQREGA